MTSILVPERSARFISLRFGESCACAKLANAAVATRTASHLAAAGMVVLPGESSRNLRMLELLLHLRACVAALELTTALTVVPVLAAIPYRARGYGAATSLTLTARVSDRRQTISRRPRRAKRRHIPDTSLPCLAMLTVFSSVNSYQKNNIEAKN